MRLIDLFEQQPAYRPNWVRYTPQSLQQDYEEYLLKQNSKWRGRAQIIGARWPLFSSLTQFSQALDQAPIVSIDDLPQGVNNLTYNDSISDIKRMVSGYNMPRDVNRIVDGIKSGATMPLPIILRGQKSMWIMAGNTRQAVSRVLGVEPQALLVDVSQTEGADTTNPG